MNSTEVQTPRRKLDDKCLCLPYVFRSVLACAIKSAHVFQESLTHFADFVSFLTNNSSSDSKAFLRFIAFSGSPAAVHRAFLFLDAKAWPQSQTDLFTCTIVLHCGHTFLRRIDLSHSVACTTEYGITLWAYLSEPLVKESLTGLSSTQYRVLQVTWITHCCYVRVTERYTEHCT